MTKEGAMNGCEMSRRDFLLTAAVAGVARTRGLWAQSAAQARQVKQSTLDRIAIMTLNFQSLLKLPDLPEGPNRTLELFAVPEMLADRYGVHKVEFQHYHIPSTEPSYLKELRAQIEKTRSTMTQINLEFGMLNMSAPELRNRLMAIDLTKMWINHAVVLGAQRVMINQGQPTHENKVYGIPALKAMADYGRSRGIIISVETRGGGRGRGASPEGAAGAAAAPPPVPPGPPTWTLLAEIIKGAGAYSNVDVGGANAADQEELHACLRTMFPMSAGSMHTRVNPRWELTTAIKFLEHELGYKGLYTIEASNGHEGTQPIYDVVVSTL
jgi:hypothetical protein